MGTVLRCLAAGAALCAPSAVSAQQPAQIDEFAFTVTTLGGREISQEDFRANVLLVDFWGTWCGPCVGSVPTLQAMYAKYKHYGLEIVGLCYERGAPQQAAAGVRRFAAQQGLTYPLALGTPEAKAQVPGFRGYPTLLFFGRGLEFRKLDVGVGEGFERELEHWIRVELGLEEARAEGPVAVRPAADRGEVPRDDFDRPAAEGPTELPAGVIFKPGDGDHGFTFEVTGADGTAVAPVDVDGEPVTMASLRGAPFVLALTSSWDGSAGATAKLLQGLHEDYGERVPVLAACLEIARQRDRKVAAIEAFRAQHELGYRLFPAGLEFQRKVHVFTGMPLLLVFDENGVLARREMGAGEATDKMLRECLKRLLGVTGDGGDQGGDGDEDGEEASDGGDGEVAPDA